jgi:cysteine sulfinate desulfinase/cysteine desulfurase-like protein
VLRWKAGLEAAGISVALPDGRLRFSPHWMNSAEQVDEVIAVVDRLSA